VKSRVTALRMCPPEKIEYSVIVFESSDRKDRRMSKQFREDFAVTKFEMKRRKKQKQKQMSQNLKQKTDRSKNSNRPTEVSLTSYKIGIKKEAEADVAKSQTED
jgi:hypothetical protein